MSKLVPKISAGDVRKWENVTKRLKEERRRTLPMIDTSEVLRRFRLSWQVARETSRKVRFTGLVEQQACFAKLRNYQP